MSRRTIATANAMKFVLHEGRDYPTQLEKDAGVAPVWHRLPYAGPQAARTARRFPEVVTWGCVREMPSSPPVRGPDLDLADAKDDQRH